MFLRNWDNIQAIKLVGAVETINPGIWGNASRTLKDYAGVVSAGAMGYFNMKYCSFTYYSTEYAAIGSADISSLKISGAWNTALGAEELAGRNIGSCYSYGGIITVGTGTAAVNYNDYTLNDLTDLTHVAYNYSTFLRNDAGKWTGFVCRHLKTKRQQLSLLLRRVYTCLFSTPMAMLRTQLPCLSRPVVQYILCGGSSYRSL
jgi:hypothetical protein